MIDSDTVIKAAKIMGTHRVIRQKLDTRGKNPKPMYRTVLYGSRAMAWAMTIYPLMSARRKAQIRVCLKDWKSKRPASNYPTERKPCSRGAKIVWTRVAGEITDNG